MFISKSIIEDIVDDGVAVLSTHPAFSDVDTTTWTEVKDVWRIIIQRNFKVSDNKHNELKRAGIQRAKEKGKFVGRQSKFDESHLVQMRYEFDDLKNHRNMGAAQLAAKWGITKSYLYQLIRNKDTKTVA